MRAPDFWYIREGRDSVPMLRLLLSPLSWLQGAMTAWRIARTIPSDAGVPVVSIGNVSLGGTGKTPIARLVRSRLSELMDGPVAIVSRGHGGSLEGPVRVDPAVHSASEVGDEPLMLAGDGPVFIGRDRAAAARLAVSSGMTAIVLDDAHQNPDVAKSLSLCVIDAGAGFGNGHLFPAGPLREKPATGLTRANAVILMGGPPVDEDASAAIAAWGGPVLKAALRPAEDNASLATLGPVLGFCGIGRPAKFEATLKQLGADLGDLIPFGDHHAYIPAELAMLKSRAAQLGATLVTTEKDAARLPAEFRDRVIVVRVEAVFDDLASLDAMLVKAIGGMW
jgi:tetraacyldisaccharide 4'-kinase